MVSPQQVEPGSLVESAAAMPPHGVRLLFSNPDVRVVEDDDTVVVSTGSGAISPDGLPVDGTMVRIRLLNGIVTDVTLARSVTTSDELYFSTGAGGGITVSDHFRNAIAVLPMGERRVSPEAVCDHFLFRTAPGYSTYVDGIQRVGQGSVVTRGRSGEVSAVLAQTMEVMDPGVGRPKDAADVLDSALELEVAPLRDLPDLANLLSGGIDSTLVQSYLGQGHTLSSSIDSPEFRFEESYARNASRILGTEHTVCTIGEREYLSRLEDCIFALGTPPHHLQTVLLDTAFQAAPSAYVTAQFADALFGLDAARRAAAVWPWRRVLRSFGARAPLPSRVRRAWTSRRNTARSLALPVRDPASFASRFAVYSEVPLAEELFGADMVERRLARRHEYVDERIRLGSEGSGLKQQLELGHWVDFFCDNTVSIWRQMAHSRGKTLHAPFSQPAIVRAAGVLPSPLRFVHRGKTKPVLRELLSRRVPRYPVNQPKGGSGLPFSRYYTDGPLAGALGTYERPDFIPDVLWARLAVEPSWTAWNALTFVIWRDRVLQDSQLPIMAGTRTLTFV